jgi:two-component system, OmpR family, response regulator ChvI
VSERGVNFSGKAAELANVVGIAGIDAELNAQVLQHLTQAYGFQTRIASDDRVGQFAALLLIEPNLERMCTDMKELRRSGFTRPVLCVGKTNDREALALAIASGADDYVAIPERLDEIPLRVLALIRHQSRTMLRVSEAKSSQSNHEAPSGGSGVHALPRTPQPHLVLDKNQRTLSFDGVTVTLTLSEMRIALYLRSCAPAWVTAAVLMEQVFGYGNHVDNTLIRVHVSSLRKKLGDHARFLESRRTLGYRWCS